MKKLQGLFFRAAFSFVILWCCAPGLVSQTRAQQPARTPAPIARPSGARPEEIPPNGQATVGDHIPARASEREIDATLPDDPRIDEMLAPYSARVRELNKPIGRLENPLQKKGIGGGTLGNFVTDAMLERARQRLGPQVAIAITNTAGLRKNEIGAGELTGADIFELMPFENALVAVDFSGAQIKQLFELVMKHNDAQSGAVVSYRGIPTDEIDVETGQRSATPRIRAEFVSARLHTAAGEQEIDPARTYTVVTLDYLVKRGGDYSPFGEGKNVRPLNLTLRDALMDYVRAQTAAGKPVSAGLDQRYRQIKEGAGTSQ